VQQFIRAPPPGGLKIEITLVAEEFKVGDHVTWNSEAGYVCGMMIKAHTRDVKTQRRHASKEDPQHEIKSTRTDHMAMHKGATLKKAVKSDYHLEQHK
jgi:hypothetical protein